MDFIDYESMELSTAAYFWAIKEEYEREHGKLLDFPATTYEGEVNGGNETEETETEVQETEGSTLRRLSARADT